MGSRRQFCLEQPPADGILPVDDMAWVRYPIFRQPRDNGVNQSWFRCDQDEGDVTRVQGHAVSTPAEIHQSPFARLCQVAILVGSVMECARKSQSVNNGSHLAETINLMNELCAFKAIVDTGTRADDQAQLLYFLAPRCLAQSALFLLLDLYTCLEKLNGQPGYLVASSVKSPEELELQNRSLRVVQELSEQAHSHAAQLLVMLEQDIFPKTKLGNISPFSLDLLYCAVATFHWLSLEKNLRNIEKCLELLGRRWKLALEYLAITKFHDVTIRSSFSFNV